VTLRSRLEEMIARRALRGCTRLGARPFVRGTPQVFNTGELIVGDDFSLSSRPVRSHLFVTGRMRIGDRVRIGAGAAISSLGRVDIDDDVAIGDFSIVMDSDFHVADDFHSAATPRPVHIGKGARLGHRVVVLPGSTIGAGATVKTGSVVSGEVAAGAVVEGNPARSRHLTPLEGADGPAEGAVSRLVMQVLGLQSLPAADAGPEQIVQWDSLGALRLIVALEETFGITLAEDQVKAARSIRELTEHVEGARLRKLGSDEAGR
jgi:acetyltransferase-like isoleucine patch superfamily enzyme/acyl carrier protein